jgi:hypothetical protein
VIKAAAISFHAIAVARGALAYNRNVALITDR